MSRARSRILLGSLLASALAGAGCTPEVTVEGDHYGAGGSGHAAAPPAADGGGGATTTGCEAATPPSSGVSIGPTGTTRILARHQPSPLAIVVHENDVYWTAAGHLMKCATTGCNLHPTTIASGHDVITGLAVDATDAYWSTLSGEVKKCSRTSCVQPTVLASGQKTPASIAVRCGFVYWTNTDNDEAVSHGSVMKCPTTGCGGHPTVLADEQNEPVAIVADDAAVYWNNNSGAGDIVKCDVGGCSGQPTVLASGQYNVESMVFAGEGLAWLTMGANEDGGTIATHARAPGGAPTIIAAGQAPSVLATDGTALFWTSIGLEYQLGMVVTCPTSACPSGPTALVPGKRLSGPIAVDAANVYWSDFAKGGATEGVILQTAR